jgi:transposase-like protein
MRAPCHECRGRGGHLPAGWHQQSALTPPVGLERFSPEYMAKKGKLEYMKAYSRDLREKIVNACARQLGSQQATAALFGVSRSFVETLLQRYRTSGELAPKLHAGGQKPRLEAAAWPVLQRLVQDNFDTT